MTYQDKIDRLARALSDNVELTLAIVDVCLEVGPIAIECVREFEDSPDLNIKIALRPLNPAKSVPIEFKKEL